MSVSLSAAISRVRHGLDLDPRLLPSPSKRSRLDPHPAAAGAACGHAPPPMTAPSPTIQFFVRGLSSETLVVRTRPDDTIASVLARAARAARASPRGLRLIFSGRQLPEELTLSACSVSNNSCLHLTGRLRSSRCPRAWQLASEIVSAVSWTACARPRASREIFLVEGLVKEFLTLTDSDLITAGCGDGDSVVDPITEHFEVFTMSGAHVALVKLYLSKVPSYREAAGEAIRHFVSPNWGSLKKEVQVRCMPILLHFCNLLAMVASKKDPLYLSCRSTFAALLDSPDWRGFISSMSLDTVILIQKLLPFAREMADIVLAGLSSDLMLVLPEDLCELLSFLRALRWALHDWLGGEGPGALQLYDGNYNREDLWISSLNAIYKDLLSKADERLKKLDDCLLKQKGQNEAHSPGWSVILAILTELNCFSEVYDDADASFNSVLRSHRFSLNAIISRAKRNNGIQWLLGHKDLLDFEARRNLVLMLFPEGKDDYIDLHEMLIDRSHLLEESFEYITQAEANALHAGLFMEFKNEEATGPGVLREWFCLVCHAIFSPQNVLFLPCANDRRRFFPNPTSTVDPMHLKYYIFSGRVIALALMHNVQVGITIDRVFFLQLAGKHITLEDIKDADPCFYMSCKKILEMDAKIMDSDALGLTFVREVHALGAQKIVELCRGGKDIAVNSKNREEYIDLLVQDCFVNSISMQVSHFARGFGDILVNSNNRKCFFGSLDLEDFDRMLGGSCSINVKEWKSHTEYNGYKPKDRQICWFWKVVEGMPANQQRTLLYFWTSVKFLPVNGFGGLASKLYIYRAAESPDHLPTSHTCFYRLCLPSYPSISMMRSRLQAITQEHVSCAFGMS